MAISFPVELADLKWVVGAEWPEADEDALRRCGQAWALAADRLRDLGPDAAQAGGAVLAAVDGEVGRCFAELWSRVCTGTDAHLSTLAEVCAELADACGRAATEVEYAKYQFVLALIALAVQIAILLAALVPSLGTSAAGLPVAVAATQITVRIIAMRLLQAVAVGLVSNVAVDGLAQLIQALRGHRHEWDRSSTQRAAGDGAIYGAATGLVLLAGGRLVPNLLHTRAGLAGAVGLAGLAGAGADAAWQGQLPAGPDLAMAFTSAFAGGASEVRGAGRVGGRPGGSAAMLLRDEATRSGPRSLAGRVEALLAGATQAEPRVTPTIREVSAAVGGVLRDDPSRVRSFHSLADTLAADPLRSPAGVRDALRYAVVLPERTYVADAQAAIRLLAERGLHPVAARSFWLDGSLARGLHTYWSEPAGGQVFEVQLHTEASHLARVVTDGRFEALRGLTPDDPRRGEAAGQIRAAINAVAVPDGVEVFAASAPATAGPAEPATAAPATAAPATAGPATATRHYHPHGEPVEVISRALVWPRATDEQAEAVARENLLVTRAGVAFYAPTDPIRNFAMAVHPTDDYLTIDVHGSARGLRIAGFDLTREQFATVMRRLVDDATVVLAPGHGVKLLSCSTGVGGALSPAAYLARSLGVEVIAPDRPVWTTVLGDEFVASSVLQDGNYVPANPPDGTWLRFPPDPVAGLPLGFAGVADFIAFAGELHDGLAAAGYPWTTAAFQGSSVTGAAYHDGRPFDVDRVSDYDLALGGDAIFDAAVSHGVALRSGGTRTGPLTAADLHRMGLAELADHLHASVGRPVAFMIYRCLDDALRRRPSIEVPRP